MIRTLRLNSRTNHLTNLRVYFIPPADTLRDFNCQIISDTVIASSLRAHQIITNALADQTLALERILWAF